MEVMVDLETMSTRNHASILVIGAIKFDRNGQNSSLDNMETFYKRIEIDSCKELGLDVDRDTMNWWSTQPDYIYEEAFKKERVPLKRALSEFSRWFRGCNLIWCQGANFDIPILSEAYARCDMKTPWKFWNVRDTRTVFDICNFKMSDLPDFNKHHALYDCLRQIIGVQKSLRK